MNNTKRICSKCGNYLSSREIRFGKSKCSPCFFEEQKCEICGERIIPYTDGYTKCRSCFFKEQGNDSEDFESDDTIDIITHKKPLIKKKRHALIVKYPPHKKGYGGIKGFACVAGMANLKQQLIADVINPLKHPKKFEKFKVSIPNGIILYGPPGCGKTFIVRKLAEELGYNFFEIKHSDLATPYIHGSVNNIGNAFKIAKQNAPIVLFFDEISGLVPDRKNLHDSSFKEEEINEFLMQLNDAADNHILVVGATNYIERIDPAILRPGRFDKKIYVPQPDLEARKELFRTGLVNRPHDKNIDFEHIAKITEGFTCADIVEDVIESTARLAANLDRDIIDQTLIEKEIKRVKSNKRLFKRKK